MSPGPVSQHLEAELRELARDHGIVVWLDKARAYTAFADALEARTQSAAFPFPVRRFRGSFLELMRQLDGHRRWSRRDAARRARSQSHA